MHYFIGCSKELRELGKMNCEMLAAIQDVSHGLKKVQKDLRVLRPDDLKLRLPLKTVGDFNELEERCVGDPEFGAKLVCCLPNKHFALPSLLR